MAKARQLLVSWTLALVAVWDCYKTGANVLELSRGKDEAADLLTKSRFIHEHLPKHLQEEKSHDGAFMLAFKGPRSRIVALPSTESAGVGQTATRVICDENEYHEYAEQNFAAVQPTISAGACLDIVSSVEKTKPDSHFKKIWYSAKEGKNGFTPIFLPYDLRTERDEQWYEDNRKLYYMDWQFLQNFPKTEEEAFSIISGHNFFSVEVVQALLNKCEKAIEVRQGTIHIFNKPKTSVRYVAGVDVGEGIGGDYSVLWVEGQEGLQRELCAIAHTNQVPPDTFAYQAYEILNEYFKPFTVGGADPLCRNFLRSLLDCGYPANKVYFSDDKKTKLGYSENESTRAEHLIALEKALREGLIIRYKPAVLEFFNFQWVQGKVLRPEGVRDDCVSAAAKANFGRKFAKQYVTVSQSESYMTKR